MRHGRAEVATEVERAQDEQDQGSGQDEGQRAPGRAARPAEPEAKGDGEVGEVGSGQELAEREVSDELFPRDPGAPRHQRLVEVGVTAPAHAREPRPGEDADDLRQPYPAHALGSSEVAQRCTFSSTSTKTNSKAFAFLTSCSTPAGRV